jgi:hypothetical protein
MSPLAKGVSPRLEKLFDTIPLASPTHQVIFRGAVWEEDAACLPLAKRQGSDNSERQSARETFFLFMIDPPNRFQERFYILTEKSR